MEHKLCELLQESIQTWNPKGKKLFCNDRTYELFDTDASNVDSLSTLLDGWKFYDASNREVDHRSLPPFQCFAHKTPTAPKTFKMVLGERTKWIVFSAMPSFNTAGELEAVSTTILDITHYKREEQRYKTIANYDPLTNLPNRTLLSDRLEHAIAQTERQQQSLAVCLIDLDGFKAVNDRYGHDTGDAVLVEATERMKQAVRHNDTVARLGGDEFVIILTGLEKGDECAVSLYRLLNLLSKPYLVGNHQISSVSASIGVSLYPDDKVEADTLLRHADMAMYKAKNSGKNKFSFFDVTSDKKIKANYRTIHTINKALDAGQFRLHYQPKVHSLSDVIREVEALARWDHPLLGIVSPAEFLPLVESDGELCAKFDKWVLIEALTQLRTWHRQGLRLKVCINISPRQFKSRQFIPWLKKIIQGCDIPAEVLSYVEFEILETAVVESHNRSNEIIEACKQMGISFALDDFGTGYSSLMHLKELAIDTIKIDRLFVSGMFEDTANMVIVQAVVALANAFDITVTAEGAEKIEHVINLLEMGCDAIQGYAIAHPLPAEELVRFVEAFVPDPRWKMVSHTLPTRVDFELLLAATNHQYWLQQVFAALTSQRFDDDILHEHPTHCRFGKWYESAKKKVYQQTPSIGKLGEVHDAIHERIAETVERLKTEDGTFTEEDKTPIAELSGELLKLLGSVRDELDAWRSKHDLINKIIEKRKQLGD